MSPSYTATFSSKGQLTFPAELRRKLGIKPGSKVSITQHPKVKTIYTVEFHKRMSLEEAYGSLYDPKREYVPIKQARETAGRALGKKYAVNR